MTVGETVYSTPYEPDVTNPHHVLAFLLVPERLFWAPGDDASTRAAVRNVLTDAKRTVLLTWYAHATRSGG